MEEINNQKSTKRTYRDAISNLLKTEDFNIFVGIDIYFEHCRRHGITDIDSTNFFNRGGRFDSFLDIDVEDDVLRAGLESYAKRCDSYKKGRVLIREGEELIKKGYKLMDDSSHVNNRHEMHIVLLDTI